MEPRRAVNPFLVVLVLLVLSCLLVYQSSPPPPGHYPYSSALMPRSLRLGSQLQQDPTALKLSSSQETTTGAAMNVGTPEARTDMELNDYPTPGANNGHDPGHGHGHGHGRA